MWRTLLKTASFGDIRALLSPQFFRVFPTSKIVSALRELIGNYRDADGFEAAVAGCREMLGPTDLAIRLDPQAETTDRVAHDRGDAILELYFRQLFEEGTTLLDLRGHRFAAEEDGLVWAPIAMYVDWDEAFIGGVRNMYRGFYTDNESEFEEGLAQLDLQGIGGVLLDHFGGEEQRAVEFEMAHFHDSFQQVLTECKERGRTLHRQFAALGLYLATLYDHLDALGGAYDARGAFRRATGRT